MILCDEMNRPQHVTRVRARMAKRFSSHTPRTTALGRGRSASSAWRTHTNRLRRTPAHTHTWSADRHNCSNLCGRLTGTRLATARTAHTGPQPFLSHGRAPPPPPPPTQQLRGTKQRANPYHPHAMLSPLHHIHGSEKLRARTVSSRQPTRHGVQARAGAERPCPASPHPSPQLHCSLAQPTA
jgi:hypothetical protein